MFVILVNFCLWLWFLWNSARKVIAPPLESFFFFLIWHHFIAFILSLHIYMFYNENQYHYEYNFLLTTVETTEIEVIVQGIFSSKEEGVVFWGHLGRNIFKRSLKRPQIWKRHPKSSPYINTSHSTDSPPPFWLWILRTTLWKIKEKECYTKVTQNKH